MYRLFRTFVFVIFLVAIGYFISNGSFSVPIAIDGQNRPTFGSSNSSTTPRETSSFVQMIREVKDNVSAPEPLRFEASGDTPEGVLSAGGVIDATNSERLAHGLPALRRNTLLDQAAAAKVQDMFAGQYFEHVSPSGVGVSDLADRVGYNYILVGENLALGNFDNDGGLVEGWMGSPGHRANILKPGFQEIGVAVGKGIFQGETTWLAVQEFGTPNSACVAPNEETKAILDADKLRLDSLAVELKNAQAELEQKRASHSLDYNDKVEEYNALVARYNALVEETKALSARYNAEVSEYNGCLQGFSS